MMSNTQSQSLRDLFLDALHRQKIPVSIYLVNGIKLQGRIERFDQDVIMLKDNLSQIVFKHAISTVVPTREVVLNGAGDVDVDAALEELAE